VNCTSVGDTLRIAVVGGSGSGADKDSGCRGYDTVEIGKWLVVVTASSRIKF